MGGGQTYNIQLTTLVQLGFRYIFAPTLLYDHVVLQHSARGVQGAASPR